MSVDAPHGDSGRVPFLDLAADFAAVADDARARIDSVLASHAFVLGPQTAELEAWLAGRTGARFAVACSSGSDALYLALRALDIGAGDAVVVPAFTFFSTAGAVANTGARPIFADIDPATFMTGPAELEAALEREGAGAGAGASASPGSRLRAVIPVHLYGATADMAGLRQVAERFSLAIVEDAAQALGAIAAEGTAGACGAVGCFSFYPTKNLGGPGDGGALVTDDSRIAERLRRLRVHGAEGAYEHHETGVNARMSELVAAVLNAKTAEFDGWLAARQRIAGHYRSALSASAEGGLLTLPAETATGAHVYHQFAVRVPRGRDEVALALAERGVETRVFYPRPLHLQPCFAELGYRAGQLPEAERAAREVLCLPIYPSLSDARVSEVCDRLTEALETAASTGPPGQ